MSFNENTAIWDTTELETRLYDGAGHLLLWIYYEWDESKQQLLPDEKETSVFEYDGENNLLEHQVDYYWDKDSSKWVCNYRGEIVFDGPPREFYKEWTDYSYDSTVGEWMAYRKDLQYRNVNGYSYQYEYYDWDDSLKIWIGKEKYGRFRGKKLCFIDDVVSTGGTIDAVLEMAKEIDIEISVIACVLTEGIRREEYKGIPLISLDHIPLPGKIG